MDSIFLFTGGGEIVPVVDAGRLTEPAILVNCNLKRILASNQGSAIRLCRFPRPGYDVMVEGDINEPSSKTRGQRASGSRSHMFQIDGSLSLRSLINLSILVLHHSVTFRLNNLQSEIYTVIDMAIRWCKSLRVKS